MNRFDPNAPQMAGLSKEQQAEKAIGFVLQRIRDHSHVGWYLGNGSASFELLTEAYATLTGRAIGDVRQMYETRNPVNPRASADD
ncbi:MAG: hypothetical protein AB7P37_21130 [Ramlibacter sp.]